MNYHSYKTKIWLNFLQKYQVVETSSKLFASSGGLCSVARKGNIGDGKPYLKRHPKMESRVIEETNLIVADFKNQDRLYDGLIYMMFKNLNGNVTPLYIGMTEKKGKSNNLSANILNLETNKGKFARWGDGYQYHIGDLSAVVLHGHEETAKSKKYKEWAASMFTEFPTDLPTLAEPIMFWCKAWSPNNVGVWEEFGPTTLTFLEYQLIGVASSLFANSLLNKEGQNR